MSRREEVKTRCPSFVFLTAFLSPVRLVPGEDRETAGSLMPFFLILGLALGASLSFPLGKLV